MSSARFVALLVAPLALVVAGCPPTISEPRSEEHARALSTGERHFRHGRLDLAVESFDEAARTAERRVDQDEALFRESRVLLRQGKYAEAVALLDRLGARRPVSRRTGRAVFDAALIRLEHLNQREQAMAGFEEVIRVHSDAGLAGRSLYYLLQDFESRGDTAGALAFCDRLYGEVGTTTAGDDLLQAKAELQLEQGDRAGARATLERLVREHPYPYGHRWDDALMTLADMDLDEGNPRAAIEHLRSLVHRNEETNLIGSYTLSTFPRAQLRIARIYRDYLRDYRAAEQAFEDLEDVFPRSILRDDALYEAGAMWIDQGNRDRGCPFLQRVVDDFEVGHARRLAVQRLEADCGVHVEDAQADETAEAGSDDAHAETESSRAAAH